MLLLTRRFLYKLFISLITDRPLLIRGLIVLMIVRPERTGGGSISLT